MATYGLVEPPRYDLEMVTCPVMLYWGDSDWLAQPRGVATIAAQLPTLVESVRVRITVFFLLSFSLVCHHHPQVDHGGFNHLDFLWGKDSVPLLYNQLLEVRQVPTFKNQPYFRSFHTSPLLHMADQRLQTETNPDMSKNIVNKIMKI